MWEMDEVAYKWLLKTCWKHFWRVANWYEFDDLVQDGYMCYYRVYSRYCTDDPYITDRGTVIEKKEDRVQVTTRAHMMRLFQLTFTNHINDIAKRHTQQQDTAVANLLLPHEDELAVLDKVVDENSEFPLTYVQLTGNEIVHKTLQVLCSEDEAIKKSLRSPYRVRDDGRQTFNERICRLANLPEGTDVKQILHDYLMSVEPSHKRSDQLIDRLVDLLVGQTTPSFKELETDLGERCERKINRLVELLLENFSNGYDRKMT